MYTYVYIEHVWVQAQTVLYILRQIVCVYSGSQRCDPIIYCMRASQCFSHVYLIGKRKRKKKNGRPFFPSSRGRHAVTNGRWWGASGSLFNVSLYIYILYTYIYMYTFGYIDYITRRGPCEKCLCAQVLLIGRAERLSIIDFSHQQAIFYSGWGPRYICLRLFCSKFRRKNTKNGVHLFRFLAIRKSNQ